MDLGFRVVEYIEEEKQQEDGCLRIECMDAVYIIGDIRFHNIQ